MKTRLLSRVLTLMILSLSLICSTAVADIPWTGSGSGGAIPDNDPNGITNTVSITQNEIITDAKFRVEGLVHSWIGDLVITVTHNGQTATLLERVGRAANAPAGARGFDTNLNGTYAFVDTGQSIWTAAALNDTNAEVAPGTYEASGAGEIPINLGVFNGTSTQGDWIFNISDRNGTALGEFTQTAVMFTSTAVPEPGTMATIVLGTMFGGLYFRRRHQKKKSEKEETETPSV